MTLFVQLSKVWNIVSNLATAHSFLDSPMVDILNEIGGAQLRLAIKEIEAASSARNPGQFIWSAAHHLDEAHELFSQNCGRETSLPSVPVLLACENAVLTALLTAACYRYHDEDAMVDRFTDLAARHMGRYETKSRRVFQVGADGEAEVKKTIRIGAKIIGQLRDDGECFYYLENFGKVPVKTESW